MPKSQVRSYRDLQVWQKGVALAKQVYLLTARFPPSEQFVLTAQMRRSAISVPSNIAEGQARGHAKEFCQYLHVALGSLAEFDTQLMIAHELGYVTQDEASAVSQGIVEIRKMTSGLLSNLPARR